MTESSFNQPRLSNSIQNFSLSPYDDKDSMPIELNQRSTQHKDRSHIAYKLPKYLNKSKAKKLDTSFVPQINKDVDNVGAHLINTYF